MLFQNLQQPRFQSYLSFPNYPWWSTPHQTQIFILQIHFDCNEYFRLFSLTNIFLMQLFSFLLFVRLKKFIPQEAVVLENSQVDHVLFQQCAQTINKIDISSSDRQGFHDMNFFNWAETCERRRGENRAKLNKSKQDIFGIPAVFFSQ